MKSIDVINEIQQRLINELDNKPNQTRQNFIIRKLKAYEKMKKRLLTINSKTKTK